MPTTLPLLRAGHQPAGGVPAAARVRDAGAAARAVADQPVRACRASRSPSRPRSSPTARTSRTCTGRPGSRWRSRSLLLPLAPAPADPQARRQVGRRGPDQHPDDDADRHRAGRVRVQPRAADLAARQHGDAGDAGHRDGQRDAVVPDDDHAPQGDPAGRRLPGDGERPVLRRDQRDLRHADGGRARHRARRAGRHAHPRRVLLPDPRAVRQPRPQAPGEAQRGRSEPRSQGWRRRSRSLVLGLPLAGGLVLARDRPPRRGAGGQRRVQPAARSSRRSRSRCA